MFNKILIANRGEIACRIARTAKRLGIRTVAVYAKAERHALHVACCDEAFLIDAEKGAGTVAEVDENENSFIEPYLNGQRIIDIAQKCGAEAIHPGYGFLSENHEFAEACARNQLVFIGPPADAIRVMGNKDLAKEVVAKVGVPLLAGYHSDAKDIKTWKAAAAEIGYPLLLKAVCGGGGKGMQLVNHADAFEESLASVKRLAQAAFGNEGVLLEQYLPHVRHVEIQIFADQHGHALHLFERDCSVQRRYQKVIEEAPAPGVDPQLREKMGAAAIHAANAIGYVGAGTVEFLLDSNNPQQFYFMEMNTRLQVEHPVTEMITGQDLVEWQFMVAAGAPLPCAQQDLRIHGHAIQARVYAEKPQQDFLPCSGEIAVYRKPSCAESWLRIDDGIRQGDPVLSGYDPMLAKLIVWGDNREIARKRLLNALTEFTIIGVSTNLEFLHRLLSLEDFIKPTLDTALIERNQKTLFADSAVSEFCLAIATLVEVNQIMNVGNSETDIDDDGDQFSPWSPALPWQLNLPSQITISFAEETDNAKNELSYTIEFAQDELFGIINGKRSRIALSPLPLRYGNFQFQYDTHLQIVSVDKIADTIHINIDGHRQALRIINKMQSKEHLATADPGLISPMPGVVVLLHVQEGQMVTRGAPLLVVSAMKMEHTIYAPHDGVVKKLFFAKGESVREGEQLLQLETQE